MLCWDKNKRSLLLEEFDRDKAMALLNKGQAVIPIWLEKIYLKLQTGHS